MSVVYNQRTIKHLYPEVQWNLHQRAIIIHNRSFFLTAMEFRLLYSMRDYIPVNYTELAMSGYRREADSRLCRMINKHMYRLRCKLQGSGLSVYSILNYGYVMLSELSAGEEAKF